MCSLVFREFVSSSSAEQFFRAADNSCGWGRGSVLRKGVFGLSRRRFALPAQKSSSCTARLYANMAHLEAKEPFAKALRRRTNRRRTATQAISNISVPIALSSPQVYSALLAAYHTIIVAFEEEFEKRRRVYPRLNAVYFRELLRAQAFARDLAHYSDGPLPPSPATLAFVKDMRAALAREPVLIIAYSYVLYMGLITASHKVVPWITRAFELKGDEGVAIWDFKGTIHNIPAFRKGYDVALNDFPLSEELKDRIVDQVHIIFEGSTAIFAEVRSSAVYSNTVKKVLFRACLGMTVLFTVIFVWFDAFKWALTTMFFPADA